MEPSFHNPDRFISDLRQVLAQGRKRIGLLLGAGIAQAIRVKPGTEEPDPDGEPIIPTVGELTRKVLDALDDSDKASVERIKKDLHDGPNIEDILSRIRLLGQALQSGKALGRTGREYSEFAERICGEIGRIVSPCLPKGHNAITRFVSWVGGTARAHAVEIFTPNYDLLLEEAFERAQLPYFDGFSGSYQPFFDAATVSNDSLPTRWTRLWKIHGSLGWDLKDGQVIAGCGRQSHRLIYPDHLKYELTKKMPYASLFERLRTFVATQDALLVACGFSFLDAHISSVIEEALAANPHGAVMAFQHGTLDGEEAGVRIARNRPNFSLYAYDGAVIRATRAKWSVGEPSSEDWRGIRDTFWGTREGRTGPGLLLGDFAFFSTFLAETHAQRTPTPDGEAATANAGDPDGPNAGGDGLDG